MIEPIGKHAKGEGLGPRQGLFSRLPVGEDTWEADYLCDPATVLFTFELYRESRNIQARSLPNPGIRACFPSKHPANVFCHNAGPRPTLIGNKAPRCLLIEPYR